MQNTCTYRLTLPPEKGLSKLLTNVLKLDYLNVSVTSWFDFVNFNIPTGQPGNEIRQLAQKGRSPVNYAVQ